MAAKRRRRKPRAREREKKRPKKAASAARARGGGKKSGSATRARAASSRARPKRQKARATPARGRKPARTSSRKGAKSTGRSSKKAASKKPAKSKKVAASARAKPRKRAKTREQPTQRHRVWIPEHVRTDGSRVRGHYRLVKGPKKRKKRPRAPSAVGAPISTPTISDQDRAPKRKPRKPRAIALPQEILDERLLRFRKRLRQQKLIKPPRGHAFGDTWFSRLDDKIVLHRNVVVAMLVTEGNIEEIVYRIMGALRSALLIMTGTMYASLYMYEYGSEIVGSPGEMFFEDENGFMWESFRGIPASFTPEQFEQNLRDELESQAAHEKSSVWMEHVTLRIARIV